MKRKKVIALTLSVFMLFSLGACGSSTAKNEAEVSPEQTQASPADTGTEKGTDAETEAQEGGRVLGLVLLNGAIEHCQHFDEGVRDVAAKNGDEVITLDGAYSVETINKCIEDLVAREVDASS